MASLTVYQYTKRDDPLAPQWVFLIDDEDLEKVEPYRWYIHFQHKKNGLVRYSCRGRIGGKMIYLHRFLMNTERAEDHVDHKDGNVFNCQKDNLRVVTPAQNMQNRPKSSRNTSGVKGLTYSKKTGYWNGTIKSNKQSFTKQSKDRETVVTWLKEQREILHGEYACHE